MKKYRWFQENGKACNAILLGKPVEPGSIDQGQLARLREFKEKCRKEGLFHEYKSIEELRVNLMNHLTRVIRDLHKVPEESGKKKTSESSETTIESFIRRYNRFEAEWRAERGSKNRSVSNGLPLLSQLFQLLLDFRTEFLTKLDRKEIFVIDVFLGNTKDIQNKYEKEIDDIPSIGFNGLPFSTFWIETDELLKNIGEFFIFIKAAETESD